MDVRDDAKRVMRLAAAEKEGVSGFGFFLLLDHSLPSLVMSVPTREALVLILDIGSTMPPSAFDLARHVCTELLQQKLVFAPRDFVGVVFAGSVGTLNRLHHSVVTSGRGTPARYSNITVVRPVMVPNKDYFEPFSSIVDRQAPVAGSPSSTPAGSPSPASGGTSATDSSPAASPSTPPAERPAPGGPACDLIDSLIVAEDLMHECTGTRSFRRRIMFVTSAAGEVKHKEALAPLVDAMKKRNVALVVVGIDFSDASAASTTADFASLSMKEQNERVLHFMVSALEGESLVIPLHDATEALHALRKRNIPQRLLGRAILDMGSIAIPVAVYTKTLKQVVPSLKLTSSKGSLFVERRYFSVRRPDVEVPPERRLKALRYGRSLIAFTDADLQRLKFKSVKSMSILGFVPTDQIPLHHIGGGCKAIAPLAGDANAERAMTTLAGSMQALKRTALVRFVYRDNSQPKIGALFASVKPSRSILYFMALPFAEDLRGFNFRSFSEVGTSAEEQASVDAMVNAMDLSEDLPKPKFAFNPSLQTHFAATRHRLLHPKGPLPPTSAALMETSCHWGAPGNVLHDVVERSKAARATVQRLFPMPAIKADGSKGDGAAGGGAARVYWFAKAGGDTETASVGSKTTRAASGGGEGDGREPQRRRREADGDAGTPSDPSLGHLSTSSLPGLHLLGPDAATAPSGAIIQHVSTVDPAGSFLTLVRRPGEDNVSRALHEVSEVILRLTRESIGEQFFDRICSALEAMRSVCIAEEEPREFNAFFMTLFSVCRLEGLMGLWTRITTRHPTLRFISSRECAESHLSDADVERMMAGPTDADDAPEDRGAERDEVSLFDELE